MHYTDYTWMKTIRDNFILLKDSHLHALRTPTLQTVISQRYIY